jgi:hypothetical protein
VGHVVCSTMSVVRNVDTLFFILGWDRYKFHKNRARTRYVELVFLHPVGFAGHVVRFGASRVWNLDALFFMLCRARCSFHKKRTGKRFAEIVFLHRGGSAGHVVHSGAPGDYCMWNTM